MIADNFWKIIFILLVLTGLVFWFKSHRENSTFKATASDLADIITFEEKARPRNEAEAQERFYKAIALVHDAEVSGISMEELFAAAFEYNDIGNDSSEARMVRNELLAARSTAEKLGLLADDGIWRLRDGEAPKITAGPFKGEKAVITRHVPASIAPEANLFMGNFVLVPESVAAVAMDLEITEDVVHTSSELWNAEIITKEQNKAIKDSFYAQKARTKY